MWFQLNQEYVATELCENKEKEELHCEGKCYLKKQLEKAETQKKDTKQEPVRPSQIKEPPFIKTCISRFHVIQAETIDSKCFIQTPVVKTIGFHPKIFHPPQTLS